MVKWNISNRSFTKFPRTLKAGANPHLGNNASKQGDHFHIERTKVTKYRNQKNLEWMTFPKYCTQSVFNFPSWASHSQLCLRLCSLLKPFVGTQRWQTWRACQSAVASVLMILNCTCHYRSKKNWSAACEWHRQSLSEEEFVSCAPSFFLASFCVHNCGDSTQKHLGTFPASASQMLGIRVTTARKAENNYIVNQWCRNSSPKSSTTGWS